MASPKASLTLLERDSASGITVYAANLGAAKSDAKTYFANLKSALNSAEGLADVQVGAATDNRMNYSLIFMVMSMIVVIKMTTGI